MNNIKILEEKIKIIESLCTDDCINKSTVIQPLKYAIENLIKENKELYENYLKLKSEMEILNNAYIPRLNVEEKIEEYNKMINATYNDISSSGDYRRNVCFEIRKVLQELLGEGGKQ